MTESKTNRNDSASKRAKAAVGDALGIVSVRGAGNLHNFPANTIGRDRVSLRLCGAAKQEGRRVTVKSNEEAINTERGKQMAEIVRGVGKMSAGQPADEHQTRRAGNKIHREDKSCQY